MTTNKQTIESVGRLRLEPRLGSHVEDVAEHVVDVVHKIGVPVAVDFNGKKLVVAPGDTVEGVLERYWARENKGEADQ